MKPVTAGKENGKEHPETRRRNRGVPVVRQGREAPLGHAAEEKGRQCADEKAHYHVLQPCGPIRSQPGKNKQEQHRTRRNSLKRYLKDPSDHPGDRLTKTDAVEGNGNGLRQTEDNTDGSPELDPKRTGYKVIVSSTFHFQVRGDSAQGYAGEHGDRVRQADNQQRPGQTGVSHDVAHSHEQDDTQDGQNAWSEYAGKRAQGTCGRLQSGFVIGLPVHNASSTCVSVESTGWYGVCRDESDAPQRHGSKDEKQELAAMNRYLSKLAFSINGLAAGNRYSGQARGAL